MNFRLEDQVEELEDDNSTLRLELRKAKEKMADLEEERLSPEDYERILNTINETLLHFEDIEDLESAVETLIEEYLDAQAPRARDGFCKMCGKHISLILSHVQA